MGSRCGRSAAGPPSPVSPSLRPGSGPPVSSPSSRRFSLPPRARPVSGSSPAPPSAPAFDVLAEAFGTRGFRLEASDEVDKTLRAALDYDGPAVVDAHVDPEENVHPLVPGGGDNTKFAMNDARLADL